jgi:exopolyphosphatase / guanosine-5'-triphosphate,3'-diphosphate pyrophosphatase
LLTDEQIQKAEVLGKAMRFGAMFSAIGPESAGALRWIPRKRVLELRLTPLGKDLFGEVTQARFKSLAAAMRATPVVIEGAENADL